MVTTRGIFQRRPDPIKALFGASTYRLGTCLPPTGEHLVRRLLIVVENFFEELKAKVGNSAPQEFFRATL